MTGDFTAQVTSVKPLSERVTELVLSMRQPERIEFMAGQYIGLRVADTADGRGIYRSFSIASSPQETQQITLCIKRVDEGATAQFLKQLEVGRAVQFTPPQGNFLLREDDTNPHWIFAATGTGIAPCRSMLLDLLHRGTNRVIELYFGVRWEEDLIYHNEFEGLAKTYPNFHYHPSITRESQTWDKRRGRITQILKSELSIGTGVSAYLCGSSEMVQEVFNILVKKGVLEMHIYMEEYIQAAAAAKH